MRTRDAPRAGRNAPQPGGPDSFLSIRSIKLSIDGALGSRGALLKAPYADAPGNKGLSFLTPAQLRNLMSRAAMDQYQIAVHAIGDGAVRIVLDGYEAALKAAGVDDLNISLDAMDPAIFAKLSGGRSIKPVLAGIVAARDAGIPIKLNAVIIRGINEGEILPLARYAAREQLPLRYIEFMPLDGRGEWTRDRVVPQADILAALRAEYAVNALPRSNDPAAYYELDNGNEIGIIATVSNPFCASCDRLRITADGSLYPCLFSKHGISLRDPMRAGADDAALGKLIRATVWNKDAGYAANPGYSDRPIAMNSLGG